MFLFLSFCSVLLLELSRARRVRVGCLGIAVICLRMQMGSRMIECLGGELNSNVL
jgi:hypothetical protein